MTQFFRKRTLSLSMVVLVMRWYFDGAEHDFTARHTARWPSLSRNWTQQGCQREVGVCGAAGHVAGDPRLLNRRRAPRPS